MTKNVKTWYSIGSAWLGRSLPDANLPLLRRVTETISIDRFEWTPGRDYMVAIRRDGRKPLKIYYGYTTGFASEEEILECLGDIHRWPTSKTRREWGIMHPENKIR